MKMYIIRFFTMIILLGQSLSPVVVFANSESINSTSTVENLTNEDTIESSIENIEVVSSEEELVIDSGVSSGKNETTEATEVTKSSSEEEMTSDSQMSTKDRAIEDTGSSFEKDLERLPEKYEEYVSLIKDQLIWDNLDLEKNISSNLYEDRVFLSKDRYRNFDGFNYLSLFDAQGELLGYIKESGVILGKGAQGLPQSYNKFISINGNYHIWDSFEWENSTPGLSYQNQTFEAREVYNHFNGFRYVSLYDSQGKLYGYINELGTTVGYGAQGPHQTYGKYISINGNYNIWDGFDWENSKLGLNYKHQTFEARGYYDHFNGSRYLSLYDSQGKWHGYINELGTTVGYGAQGPHQTYGKYISVNGNYNIWDGFDWKNSKLGLNYKHQTFEARGYYDHFNGSRYLSLYDSQGKWHGYINELGTTVGYGAQGPHQAYGKYISVNGNYDIWNSFEWKSKQPGKNYKNRTLQARGIYRHFNGSNYLSLYDNAGKWLGYINENGTKITSGAQGSYQKYEQYVTIKSEDYAIWRNFSWSSKASGKFAGKTYFAKGVYNHFNGSRYLSLYDAKDNWIGYINENGTKLGKSQAEKFKKVQELLNKEYKSKNFGVYVTSLVDGSVAEINGNQQFHAASTGKLPALYYTQKMILDKKVDGNYPYLYTDAINQMTNSYMRGGAGILQGQAYGRKFSLNTIMNWTAKYSDNQGTNFIAYYAANKYDATMKKEISRIMGRNWTSPFYVNAKDNAMMLEAIYHQGGKLITDLSNTVYDDQRIPKYIPVKVAHKIGDLNDLRHDAGIIYSNQPYTLSILTKNYQSYEQISILSKKIYDILK